MPSPFANWATAAKASNPGLVRTGVSELPDELLEKALRLLDRPALGRALISLGHRGHELAQRLTDLITDLIIQYLGREPTAPQRMIVNNGAVRFSQKFGLQDLVIRGTCDARERDVPGWLLLGPCFLSLGRCDYHYLGRQSLLTNRARVHALLGSLGTATDYAESRRGAGEVLDSLCAHEVGVLTDVRSAQDLMLLSMPDITRPHARVLFLVSKGVHRVCHSEYCGCSGMLFDTVDVLFPEATEPVLLWAASIHFSPHSSGTAEIAPYHCDTCSPATAARLAQAVGINESISQALTLWDVITIITTAAGTNGFLRYTNFLRRLTGIPMAHPALGAEERRAIEEELPDNDARFRHVVLPPYVSSWPPHCHCRHRRLAEP